jgi:hypothetical protein
MPTFTPSTINALRVNFANLAAADVPFAASLLASADKCALRGWQLSEKQKHWLAVLAERASAPQSAPESVGDMSGLLHLFQTARGHQKRPAITAQSPVGTIRLSLAGERARNPGSINVAEKGRFGESCRMERGRVADRQRPPSSTTSRLLRPIRRAWPQSMDTRRGLAASAVAT